MKKVSLLAGMLSGCVLLSGCLSHWFVDSTTRLQIENKTDLYITGFDIRAEDGSYWRWVKDTIAPGERSRVYEEDFVGTFEARLRLTDSEEFFKVEFDGGSYYMVAKKVDGKLKLEFR